MSAVQNPAKVPIFQGNHPLKGEALTAASRLTIPQKKEDIKVSTIGQVILNNNFPGKPPIDSKKDLGALDSYGYVVAVPTVAKTDIQGLLRLYVEKGFKAKGDFSRIQMLFAINQMYSITQLEEDQKTVIKKAVTKEINAPFEVTKFGFLWYPQWQLRGCRSRRSQMLSAEDVRKIYRECLTLGDSGAKYAAKLAEIEKGAKINKLVPYAGIMERLRTEAEKPIAALRSLNPEREVFLLFQHSEVLNPNGVFTNYDELLKAHRTAMGVFPKIATTWYHVESRIPHNALGAELDMVMRQATAEVLPFGSYPPEPNSALHVPQGKLTFPIPFSNKRKREMDSIMYPMLNDLQFNKRPEAFASKIAPVTIRARPRMEKMKNSNTDKRYHCRPNKEGLLRGITDQDLSYWFSFAQSVSSRRNWIQQIKRAFYPNCGFKDSYTQVDQLLKLLNPRDLAELIKKEKTEGKCDGFSLYFKEIVANYEDSIPQETLKQATQALVEHLKKEEKLEEKKALLFANKIAEAAKAAGKAAASFFKKRADFSFASSCLAICEDVFGKELNPGENGATHQMIFNTTLRTKGNKNTIKSSTLKKLCEEQPLGAYDMTALHMAALVGDVELAKIILALKGQPGGSCASKECGYIPFYFALEHCIQYGPNENLLDLFLPDKIDETGTPWKEPLLHRIIDLMREPKTLINIIIDHVSPSSITTAARYAFEQEDFNTFCFLLNRDECELDRNFLDDLIRQEDAEMQVWWPILKEKGYRDPVELFDEWSIGDPADSRFSIDDYERFRSDTGEIVLHPIESECISTLKPNFTKNFEEWAQRWHGMKEKVADPFAWPQLFTAFFYKPHRPNIGWTSLMAMSGGSFEKEVQELVPSLSKEESELFDFIISIHPLSFGIPLALSYDIDVLEICRLAHKISQESEDPVNDYGLPLTFHLSLKKADTDQAQNEDSMEAEDKTDAAPESPSVQGKKRPAEENDPRKDLKRPRFDSSMEE